jgi:hypothetical protein
MHGLSIYVIHYSPLVERHSNINTLRSCLGDINVITENEYSRYAASRYSEYLSNNSATFSCVHAYINSILDILCLNLKEISGNLSRTSSLFCNKANNHTANFFVSQATNAFSAANIELCLQHYAAIEHLRKTGAGWGLILEDDVIVRNNGARDALSDMIGKFDKLPSPAYVDVGRSLGLVGATALKFADCAFIQEKGRTRCSSSYLVNNAASSSILHHKCQPVLPIDWCLSLVLKRAKIPTYWSQEEFFTQGSENGIVASNQSKRNTSAAINTDIGS